MKTKFFKNNFWLLILAILILAAVSRFLFLGARPMHHDEGMLAYFAWRLVEAREYSYTPQIHGPILFYVQVFFFLIFGTSDFVARLGPACFGIFLVIIPLLFWRQLGRRQAVAISILFLISPLFWYYSRFLVHTSLVIVFWLATILFLKQFVVKPNRLSLNLSALFLSLSFGTSETSYFFLAAIALFIPALYLYDRDLYCRYWKQIRNFFREDPIFDILTPLIVFILVWAIIYSVGFSNPKSLVDSLPNPFNKDSGLGFWLTQHGKRLGSQPPYYYLILLLLYEPIILVSSVAALLSRQKRAFFLFLLWLAAMLLIGFSWAGEKFPWLALCATFGLFLFSGFYLGENWPKFSRLTKIIWLLLLLVSILNGIRLNFFRQADTKEMAVYVQTPVSFQKVIDEIRNNCQKDKQLDCVLIDQKITWPLSWEFREFSTLVFAENIVPGEGTKYILISNESQDKINISDDWLKQKIWLRDWWVPERCRKEYCLDKFLNYFVSRKTWNEQGGYDVYIFRRGGLAAKADL